MPFFCILIGKNYYETQLTGINWDHQNRHYYWKSKKWRERKRRVEKDGLKGGEDKRCRCQLWHHGNRELFLRDCRGATNTQRHLCNQFIACFYQFLVVRVTIIWNAFATSNSYEVNFKNTLSVFLKDRAKWTPYIRRLLLWRLHRRWTRPLPRPERGKMLLPRVLRCTGEKRKLQKTARYMICLAPRPLMSFACIKRNAAIALRSRPVAFSPLRCW